MDPRVAKQKKRNPTNVAANEFLTYWHALKWTSGRKRHAFHPDVLQLGVQIIDPFHGLYIADFA